jgi:AraC-like DNA-binding protein
MNTVTRAPQRTSVHSHHAIQITVALHGTFSFTAGGRVVRGDAVAVAPDTRHEFELQGAVAHLFVEPDGRLGRAAAGALFSKGDVVKVPARLLADATAGLKAASRRHGSTREELVELGRAALLSLAGEATPAPADLRVQQMIGWAEGRLEGTTGLKDAAAVVGLSPGRARHLFVEQTGLRFRAFLLWRRLNRALELYTSGHSLTDAAHAAGFSDSAHLSRTFRRMFGVAAAELRLE